MKPQVGVDQMIERKCSKPRQDDGAYFFRKDACLDLFEQSYYEFETLLNYQYHYIISKKQTLRSFVLNFYKEDFHHLAGLHKLRDMEQLRSGSRGKIYEGIRQGYITLQTLQKSDHFEESYKRLFPLSHLTSIIEDNKIVFRYLKNKNPSSRIDADYLIENRATGNPEYLFLVDRDKKSNCVCCSIFPKEKLDFARNQPKYTLMQLTKTDLRTGLEEIIYQHPNFK